MGLDIYIYAEQREVHGNWTLASGLEENQSWYLDELEYDPNAELKPWPPTVPSCAVDIGRDRELFAILADVGNGTRTANAMRYECIASQRGLPEDLSPEMSEFTQLVGAGIRYPSWLMLDEIIRFPWREKTMLREAMVDRRVAHLYHKTGQQFRSGYPVAGWPANVPMGYAAGMLDGVTVRWNETYYDITSEFQEALEDLRKLGNPQDIRLVFWFN